MAADLASSRRRRARRGRGVDRPLLPAGWLDTVAPAGENYDIVRQDPIMLACFRVIGARHPGCSQVRA
jgi:hypothetical protein